LKWSSQSSSLSRSLGDHPAVYRHNDRSDPRGLVAGEKGDGVRDVDRLTNPPDWMNANKTPQGSRQQLLSG
jgi:hypothetical protein